MSKEKEQIQQTKHELISKERMQSIEMYAPVSLCTAWKGWHIPQVMNDQLPGKENTSEKLMSVSIELKYMKWIT